MDQQDIKYFQHQKEVKNPVFLKRFPGIDFKGKRVLDLGCGHGALSVDITLKGASEVVGIDINCDLIKFASQNLELNYPVLNERISFKCTDISELPNDHFDIIISKASFEHIIDLDILMKEMRNKLKKGGKIITGFGPLYNSPWGDHNRLNHLLPWSHVIFGEKHFIKKLNRKNKNKINSIHDLGLNGYSLKKYIDIFNNTEGLIVIDIRINESHRLSMKLFKLFADIPFLKEYFTYNIYCILERKY